MARCSLFELNETREESEQESLLLLAKFAIFLMELSLPARKFLN